MTVDEKLPKMQPMIKNEIVYVRITGKEESNLAHLTCDILAKYAVVILDVRQALIHEHFTLSLLLQIPGEATGVYRDLVFELTGLGLTVRFTPIPLEEYTSWLKAPAKPQYIITLLARKLTGWQLSSVTRIIHQHGLSIENMHRLSGRVPLISDEKSKISFELTVQGELSDFNALRIAFLEAGALHEMDIAFQKDNAYRRNRRLVCFDMDSTLIEAEVIDELAKLQGVGDQVMKITESAMRGEIDFAESLTQRVALLKGLPVSQLAHLALHLPLTEGVEKLMSSLRALGYKTAILSGGFTYFGDVLKKKLRMDYMFANELEMKEGVLTGKVLGDIMDAARKADTLKFLAEKEHIHLEQVIAVGDGANDIPMLNLAGLGIAFRAKPIVRHSARQAISTLGLDAILYLLGVRDSDHADFEALGL